MTTYTFQWKRDGSVISGAINSTYTLVSADVGKIISVDVTDTNASALSTTATAAGVGPITVAVLSDTPTTFTDTAYTTNQTSHYETSPLARVLYTTDATSITVNGYTDIYSHDSTLSHLAVFVNGVFNSIVNATADGTFSGTISGLAAGSKTIEIVNGAQTKPGALYGTYLVSISANAGLARYYPTYTSRTVFLVDSIGEGTKGAIPAKDGYLPRMRYSTSDSLIAMGYGFGTLAGIAVDTPTINATVATLAALSPNRIVNTLGTNDYGYAATSSSAYQSQYAALNDAIHASMSSAAIIALTPIVRSVETANTSGSTMAQFRTAVATAASGRSWVTVVDGSAILTTAELADGVHPTTIGHALFATNFGPSLGYSPPAYVFPVFSAGPDTNGSVTSLGGGVYRAQKTAAGTGFNTGFYGAPQTGDFRYMIDVNNSQDTIFGLSSKGYAQSDYTDFTYGLYFAPGGYTAYDAGVAGAGYGATAVGDRIWVARTGSAVTFSRGPNFTAAIPIRTVTLSGTVYFDVSMYTSGGQIDATPVAGDGTALADFYAGPDRLGAITTPSAGVSRMTKIAGGASGFNTGFYSPNRSGDFRYQITVPTLVEMMIGVDSTPTSSSGYADIAKAMNIAGGGSITAYDSGTAGASLGTYVAGDIFWIDRAGTTLTMKKGATYAGATTLRTDTVSGTVGLDVSLYTATQYIDGVKVS